MSSENAKIDDNRFRTLLGVTDDANEEIRRLIVDATTGRLKVSAVIAGFGSTQQDTVTTADETQTVISEISASASNIYYVEAKVLGVKDDGSQRAIFHISGLFYRDGSGNITQQGTTNAINIIRSDTDWSVDFAVDTTNQEIEVKVTGKSGTNIDWQSNIIYNTLSE